MEECPEATTALLIGSWKCEAHRPLRGERTSAPAVRKKHGIRRVLVKYGEWFPPDAWVEGDLDNMKRLMQTKDIPVYDVFDYRERSEEGVYSLGKFDIFDRIREFFAQEDKTHFVLYFTGHGDVEGSWVVPVTTACYKKPKERTARKAKSLDGATSDARSPFASPTGIKSDTTKYVRRKGTPVSDATEQSRSPASSPFVATDESTMKMVSVQKPEHNLRPAPMKLWNDLIKYEDIVRLWDDSNPEKDTHRRLMLILECSHSGRWVQRVNGETVYEHVELDEDSVDITEKQSTRRPDICVQAACGPSEVPTVAENQLSSVFTRAFLSAQNKSWFEKCVLTCFDHLFVLNFVSIARSCECHQFSPISSNSGPFGGIQFFDSFDDMHLNT